MEAFFIVLNPVLTLFICMAIGFALQKFKIVPESTSKSLARLETTVFCPALAFMSMANAFTPSSIAKHSANLLVSTILLFLALIIGISLSYLFVKKKSYERYVYQYALAFANFGYMADPLVQALFGDAVLGSYKFFSLPFSICVYVWGITILTPAENRTSSPLKRILNFPTVALIIGMVFGLTSALPFVPSFITSTLNSLKACMGPVAMIMTGLTIAKYDVKRLLTNKKVYLATALRLTLLPAFLIACAIAVRAGINAIFDAEIISAEPVYFAFFAFAMPLGMNTVVFPESYGGDPEPGASMALVSSAFSILTIPLMYTLLTIIVQCPF